MTQVPVGRYRLRGGRALALLIIAVGLIGWGSYVAVARMQPAEITSVRLAVGSSITRRFQVGQFLADEAREYGLEMDVVPGGGIQESLRKAALGELDLGFAPAGLYAPGGGSLCLLAGLDVEPLHILVRREVADAASSLQDAIRGRRVSLGAPDTVDRLVASDVLGFLRLSAKDRAGRGDYYDVSVDKDILVRLADQFQTATQSQRAELLRRCPDVVMFVGELPSTVAQRLFDTGQYTLLPFPYTEHYLSSQLQRPDYSRLGVDRLGIQGVEIPAAMYVGSSPIPATGCATIGLRMLLVGRRDLPDKTIRQIMRSVFETDFATRIHPQSPREVSTILPIHAAAIAYLDRNKPLVTGSLFEEIGDLLTIFGAFSAGALSLYGYLRRRRIRRPGEYLEEIRRIDALAMGQPLDGEASPSADELPGYLQTRLVKLKQQLIQDYCNNRVQGDAVLMNILSMLADSRSHLGRSASAPGFTGPTPRPEATNRDSIPIGQASGQPEPGGSRAA